MFPHTTNQPAKSDAYALAATPDTVHGTIQLPTPPALSMAWPLITSKHDPHPRQRRETSFALLPSTTRSNFSVDNEVARTSHSSLVSAEGELKRNQPHLRRRGEDQTQNRDKCEEARARRIKPSHPQHYPRRTPAIWRQLHKAHERNHAELPMQLGLDSIENGRFGT